MKKNIIRVILIILLLGTFSIIFGFSSQDGEKSGGLSKKITEVVISKVPKIKELDEIEKEDLMYRTEKVIRKIAHFSIYTVVGILLMAYMSTYQLKEKNRMIISTILGILYASSDELHQYFIPGRSAQITDVMIDTLGVLVGICLVSLIVRIIKREKTTEIDNK